MVRRRLLTVTLLVAMLGACDRHSAPPPVSPAVQRGQTLFETHCAVCHSVTDDGAITAPILGGIVGRPAGAAGFDYSEAMRASGLVWTPETLDRFLEAPRDLVPGNEMAFFGMPDPQMRGDLIGYLASTEAPES